jgi:hypothetical protein
MLSDMNAILRIIFPVHASFIFPLTQVDSLAQKFIQRAALACATKCVTRAGNCNAISRSAVLIFDLDSVRTRTR